MTRKRCHSVLLYFCIILLRNGEITVGRIGTIINRKGKQDAKKAKEFTKLGRYIMVAAKEGGT